ncbi:peptidase inhibitor I78 family protein [Sphingomonas sp. So64.6b]|uniref:I78 family peptidase inhibitor n=1 Tax=Sphingomonas sp. So64.6b TaxID=2997354 RepID=UPI0015FFE106|nr:I78 family peptidase inhibitor [Sphingomonas sp. So64.6b]QNA83937.1 peptidase inhibitor I78 family protein [Sphingomonas sp. So64.6b]
MKIATALIAPAMVAAFALAGCMEGRPTPLPGPPRACNADRAQNLIGQRATPALVGKAKRRSGASVARRITPEMRVTMEFRADRVNVWVSTDGRAERISCG